MIDRAVRLALAASSTTSIVLLIGFNLLPLAGVVFAGWNVATLLVLYWVENGIVGALNIPKILLARGSGPGWLAVGGLTDDGGPFARVVVVLFFLVHYGIFWLVHGVFVLTLTSFAGQGGGPLGPGGGLGAFPPGAFPPTFPPTFPPGSSPDVAIVGAAAGPDLAAVAWGALGLAISHTASFVVNFLGRREYLEVSPAQQMAAPYGRVVVLHLTILLGAFISLTIGSPIGAVIALVVLKTAVDLAFHLREHRGSAVRPDGV